MSHWDAAVSRVHSWRGPMQGRLNRRLLMWFLIFSIVPLIGTNAVGYRRTHAIIRQLVARSLTSIAEVQAQHIRDRVDRHLLLLQSVAAGNDFLVAGAMEAQGLPSGEMGKVASRSAMEYQLERKREELPAFTALYVYTPGGRVLAAAGAASAIRIRVPDSGQGPSLNVGFSREGGASQPEFELVAPLIGHGGAAVAYVGGTIRLSAFRDFLQLPARMPGRVQAFLVDSIGRPLFVSEESAHMNYAAPLPHALLRMPADSESVVQYDDNGVAMLGAVAAVPNHPWRLVVQQPAAEAFGELRALGGLSLLLELLFGILIVGMAWIVAADIVAPVGRLVDATRKVGAGDLSVRVSATQDDEIGELGRAFNEMTADLAETTERVSELHQREIERASQLATVGELASGIAHEIKNPVVGVSNGLDLVRRRVGNDPTLSPITEEMARQLARIQLAMQELLTFARPATPTLVPVSVRRLVERAIRLVQPMAERAGVTIDIETDRGVPRFFADEEMLHQALVNVVMNAVQATASGGSVVVTARAADEQIHISVADTGRGIAPENVEAVFKPFFTTRHTGTGLGLSITREIAQRHGGTVTLKTRVNVGTTVTMHLPAASAPEAVEEAVAV